MTNEQFDIWLKIFARDPDTPANVAARRVILEGVSQSEAAHDAGITRGTVSKAVKRFLEADALVRDAYMAKAQPQPKKKPRSTTIGERTNQAAVATK